MLGLYDSTGVERMNFDLDYFTVRRQRLRATTPWASGVVKAT